MIIEYIHSFIQTLKNRGQARYFTPSQITEAVNSSVLDMFNEGRKDYEQTQVINDLMRVFKADATVSLTAGVGSLPSNYASITGFDKKVDLVDDASWGEIKTDIVCPPATEYPFASVTGSTIKVLPTTIATIGIKYLKKPTDSVYATTTSGDGRSFIFNSGASTDVEIPEHRKTELLAKVCKYLGISLKDADLIQFETIKNQTDK
jgi:hypothetical protein